MIVNGISGGNAKLLEAIDFYIATETPVPGGDVPTSAIRLDTFSNTEYTLAPGNFFDGSETGSTSGKILYLVGHMDENAGNEYQGLSIDGVGITVNATQKDAEFDSFDNQYDKDATIPLSSSVQGNLNVTKTGSTVTVLGEAQIIKDANMAVEYPEGVTLKTDTDVTGEGENAKATVGQKLEYIGNTLSNEATENNVELKADQTAAHYELTLPVDKDKNTILVPVTVNYTLNLVGVKVYHNGKPLENGVQADKEYFTYDPATGELVLGLFNASPIDIVSDTPAAVIGSTVYATLQDAIDSVNTKYGTTITLCKDIEETVTTSAKPSNGKYEVRLNFDGHTLTGDINNGSFGIYLNKESSGTIIGNLNNIGANSEKSDNPYLRVYNTVVQGNITCGADENKYSKDNVSINDGSHVTGTLTKGGQGTITANIGSCFKESPKDFLPSGTQVKELDTADGHGCKYQVAANEVAQIIRNGESTTYPTLYKTFQAMQDGDTIEILKDISENTSFQIGKSVTIDLKGHSITSNVATLFKINKEDAPRINVVIKNGTLNNDKTGEGQYCVIWALRQVDLTLENVKLEASGEKTIGMQIGSADTGSNPTVTIRGAESAVTGKMAGIGIFNNNDGNADGPTSGTLVVENGTITGCWYGITGNGVNHNTSITINGGTV